jgi:hypothetical protein
VDTNIVSDSTDGFLPRDGKEFLEFLKAVAGGVAEAAGGLAVGAVQGILKIRQAVGKCVFARPRGPFRR